MVVVSERAAAIVVSVADGFAEGIGDFDGQIKEPRVLGCSGDAGEVGTLDDESILDDFTGGVVGSRDSREAGTLPRGGEFRPCFRRISTSIDHDYFTVQSWTHLRY